MPPATRLTATSNNDDGVNERLRSVEKTLDTITQTMQEMMVMNKGMNDNAFRVASCKFVKLHPPIKKDAIEAMVRELLEAGVIKPSNSPFASHIVMIKKKDNTWRMCVDYRQLNKNTGKDKFLIPIIEELIDELHGASVFSKLDLRSSYHQIRMCEEDIVKTALSRLMKGIMSF
nr:reverse transcriptase [Tanacetum cinerariifolium]